MDKKRPVGVTILSIMISISFGVLPLTVSYMFLSSQDLSKSIEINPAILYVNFAVSLGIIISTFFTWKGNNQAKKIMLILVCLYQVSIIYYNINLLLDPSALGLEILEDKQKNKLYSNIIRSLLWFVLLYWYFNTKKAKEFFAKQS